MINDYLQMSASTNLNLKNRKSIVSWLDHMPFCLTDYTPVVASPVDVDGCGSSGLTSKFTAALATSLNV